MFGQISLTLEKCVRFGNPSSTPCRRTTEQEHGFVVQHLRHVRHSARVVERVSEEAPLAFTPEHPCPTTPRAVSEVVVSRAIPRVVCGPTPQPTPPLRAQTPANATRAVSQPTLRVWPRTLTNTHRVAPVPNAVGFDWRSPTMFRSIEPSGNRPQGSGFAIALNGLPRV